MSIVYTCSQCGFAATKLKMREHRKNPCDPEKVKNYLLWKEEEENKRKEECIRIKQMQERKRLERNDDLADYVIVEREKLTDNSPIGQLTREVIWGARGRKSGREIFGEFEDVRAVRKIIINTDTQEREKMPWVIRYRSGGYESLEEAKLQLKLIETAIAFVERNG